VTEENHMTPEQLYELIFGENWREHPDYLRGREWVREKFYDGGPMPSDRDQTGLSDG